MDKVLIFITILCIIPLFCIDASAEELDRSAFTTTIETPTADGVTEVDTTPNDTTEVSSTDVATLIYVIGSILIFAIAFVCGSIVAGYLI